MSAALAAVDGLIIEAEAAYDGAVAHDVVDADIALIQRLGNALHAARLEMQRLSRRPSLDDVTLAARDIINDGMGTELHISGPDAGRIARAVLATFPAVGSDLEGATARGPADSWPANAGEFAARFNALSLEEREERVARIVENAQLAAQVAGGAYVKWSLVMDAWEQTTLGARS